LTLVEDQLPSPIKPSDSAPSTDVDDSRFRPHVDPSEEQYEQDMSVRVDTVKGQSASSSTTHSVSRVTYPVPVIDPIKRFISTKIKAGQTRAFDWLSQGRQYQVERTGESDYNLISAIDNSISPFKVNDNFYTDVSMTGSYPDLRISRKGDELTLAYMEFSRYDMKGNKLTFSLPNGTRADLKPSTGETIIMRRVQSYGIL